MFFSILTTAFNDANNFEKFFDSIEAQTLKPIEIIVADGGSKDDSKDVISKISEKYTYAIRFIETTQRLNIPQGYNVAVQECATDKMIIMGIGNSYNPHFCESMFNYYEKHDVDIVYTPVVGINQNIFSEAFNIAFVGGSKGKDFGLASNRGVFLSKKVFDQIGYFYEGFVYAGEDTEYFIRANNAGLKVGYNTKGVVYWETPVNFKEYLKKNKVNAIADMQCLKNKEIVKHISNRCALIMVLVALAVVRWYLPVIVVVGLLGLIILKIKSVNPLAILLRLHFIFLPSYYYLKNGKYFSQEYKMKS